MAKQDWIAKQEQVNYFNKRHGARDFFNQETPPAETQSGADVEGSGNRHKREHYPALLRGMQQGGGKKQRNQWDLQLLPSAATPWAVVRSDPPPEQIQTAAAPSWVLEKRKNTNGIDLFSYFVRLLWNVRDATINCQIVANRYVKVNV